MTGAEDLGRQAGESSAHIQQEDSSAPPPGLADKPADPASIPISPVDDQELAETEVELIEEDYTDPRQQAMALNLTQRQQEERFLEQLAARDYTGTMWDYFSNELAAYGVPVLMSWTRTRKIMKLCADKGRPIDPPPMEWAVEDRSGVTALAVAKAISVFRDRVLRPGVWDPSRGATIKTFFMGAVIHQFPNFYNSWRNEHLHALCRPAERSFEDALAVSVLAAEQPGSDPARTVTSRLHLLRVLEDMPEPLRIACLLILEGYSVKDAAAAIGKSGNALSEQLRRYRNGRGRRLA